MPDTSMRERGRSRYFLRGVIRTTTGLHVGSGYGSERTDATVMRDAWGNPFIPGSSLKGSLRSHVEQLVDGLASDAIRTCCLIEGDEQRCVTVNKTWRERYSAWQEQLDRGKTEADLVAFLAGEHGEERLCDTCHLFGSPYSQSRLFVRDLPWLAPADAHASRDLVRGEIRHGVGIDRDTLTARDKIKFDFEALPSQLDFDFEITLERPSPLDLALVAVGLQELRLGNLTLGGIRSRGLGRCELLLQPIRQVDLGDRASLIAYLRQGQDGGTEIGVDRFFDEQFANLERWLSGEEG